MLNTGYFMLLSCKHTFISIQTYIYTYTTSLTSHAFLPHQFLLLLLPLLHPSSPAPSNPNESSATLFSAVSRGCRPLLHTTLPKAVPGQG